MLYSGKENHNYHNLGDSDDLHNDMYYRIYIYVYKEQHRPQFLSMPFSSASGSYGCRMLAEIRESAHEWTWESWHRNKFQESRPVTSEV